MEQGTQAWFASRGLSTCAQEGEGADADPAGGVAVAAADRSPAAGARNRKSTAKEPQQVSEQSTGGVSNAPLDNSGGDAVG